MKKIVSQRMPDGSLYRVMQTADEAYLEYFDRDGNMEVIVKGELSFVETVFGEKITGSSSEPGLASGAAVAELGVDCGHDPCTHPDCGCQPVSAPVDPAPFGE